MDQPDFIPDEQSSASAPPVQGQPAAPDFIPDEAPDFIPDEQAQPQAQDSQALSPITAGVANFARHATAGLTDLAAGKLRDLGTALGTSPENLHYWAPAPSQIESAKEQFKEAHPVANAITDIGGDIALMSKIPAFKATGVLANIGVGALNGAIQMGAIAAGDDLSKAMLGDKSYDQHAVASHILHNGAWGLLLGGATGSVGEGLKAASKLAAEKELGNYALSVAVGAGHAANGAAENTPASVKVAQEAVNKLKQEYPSLSKNGFSFGNNMYQKVVQNGIVGSIAGAAATGAGAAGATLGSVLGPEGAVLGGKLGAAAGTTFAINKAAPLAGKLSQKVIAPIILKMASSGNVQGIAKAVDYGIAASKGAQAMSKAVGSLFKAGAMEGIRDLSDAEKQRDKVKKYIEDGGIDSQLKEQTSSQGFAVGGEVKPMSELNQPNPIADQWPGQNMLLNAAKARVSNYLKSSRPMPPITSKTYDTVNKDHQKEKEYDSLVDLANNPLSILKKIKNGSLLPKHVKDFTSMYPEIHDELSKEITKKIDEGKLKGEKKPPYPIRQAMSLFLGASLDSTLTQPSMMAAQSVFMQQKAQAAAQKTAPLSKMGQASKTPDQSREERLNKN